MKILKISSFGRTEQTELAFSVVFCALIKTEAGGNSESFERKLGLVDLGRTWLTQKSNVGHLS